LGFKVSFSCSPVQFWYLWKYNLYQVLVRFHPFGGGGKFKKNPQRLARTLLVESISVTILVSSSWRTPGPSGALPILLDGTTFTGRFVPWYFMRLDYWNQGLLARGCMPEVETEVGKRVKKNPTQIWPYLCGILFNSFPNLPPLCDRYVY